MAIVPSGDFNGDGRGDLLWRDSSGTLSEWQQEGQFHFSWVPGSAFTVSNDWSIRGFGDFNGDGLSDILWQQPGTGLGMDWLSAGTSFAWHSTFEVPTGYQFVGIGDFNGDGRDDILWRDADGTLSQWRSQASGQFEWNPNAAFQVDNNLQIIGIGDFNSDGRDDLVWREAGTGVVSIWDANAQGSYTWIANYNTTPDMQLLAVAEVWNFGGGDDLVWRDSSGTVSTWGSTGPGFAWLGGSPLAPAPTFDVPANSDLLAVLDQNVFGTNQLFVWKTDAGLIYIQEGVTYEYPAGFHIQPDPLF